jgi:hypothetical protein
MTIGVLKSVDLVSIDDPERASTIAINCSRQCRFHPLALFAELSRGNLHCVPIDSLRPTSCKLSSCVRGSIASQD